MAEPPFNEYEQRFLLAEIIKTAPVPPSDILRFIIDRDIEPQWEAMAMPFGRSINSCKGNYSLMRGPPRALISGSGHQQETTGAVMQSTLQNQQTPFGQGQGFGQRGGFNQPAQGSAGLPGSVHYRQPPTGDLPLKARPSAPDPSMHPQFSHFAAVNENPSTPRAYLAGPDAQAPGSDKKSKKRGRPSKADYEIRAAEAKARGDPWPPPKKTKIPRTSAEAASGFGEPPDVMSSKTKPGRKPKVKLGPGAASGRGDVPQGPTAVTTTAGEISPEDEAQIAQGILIGTPEGRKRSTIPESQASELSGTESLIAGMREQAGKSIRASGTEDRALASQILPTQAETAQSSVTIKQSSTPQILPRSNMSQA